MLLTGSVVINEIHYHPDIKTEAVEFVEITNPGDAAVDLSGAAFTSGIGYTFPAGTSLPAGGYLCVAENPTAFQTKFGTTALGPYTGNLSNTGDDLVIKDAVGHTLDEVNYGAGFPWPTVGDTPGYSIELINPNLDNSLGGNWRSHIPASVTDQTLVAAGSTWDYRKGTSEASTPDTTAWRQLAFSEDATWAHNAATPIGYDPALGMGTTLSDMQRVGSTGGYLSVFMRKTFTVTDPSVFTSMRMEAQYDDGFNVWINGVRVANSNVTTSPTINSVASSTREDNTFSTFALPAAGTYLHAGTNVIAVEFTNVSISTSSDAFFNCRLIGSTGNNGGGPTPGRKNANFAANAPPDLRQLSQTPQTPASGQPVTITMKVTDPDNVAGVNLQYQLVDPGSYINYTDPAYQTNWTSVPMVDDGTNGDAAAGDGVYTVVLPGSLQVNRRLVRYRVVATDGLGASVTGPYPDDAQLNFAYFCYDGNPAFTAAAQPGVTPAVTYSAALMNSIPNYILITKQTDAENSTWYSNYQGEEYLWQGTIVYNGQVFDNVGYRPRGGVWRYAMGKNAWKFNFAQNHEVNILDNYGNPLPAWSKVNLRPLIQQADFLNRGEQGLYESASLRLMQLAGVPASNTAFVQLRIIDKASQTGTSQYTGDLWGLYLAVENYDEGFKDAHGLPDGNLYDMQPGEPGGGVLQAHSSLLPSDNSDLVNFTGTYTSTTPTDQWWQDNVDLDEYYSYRAIVEAVHHYDIDQSAGKNYEFFHRPQDPTDPNSGKWEVFPWDTDLTWADNMYGGGDEPFRSRVLPRATFSIDYKNRVRELRDLLYNPEQTGQLIDEIASKVYTPGQPSFVDVDRALWDYNPTMVDTSKNVQTGKAGQGKFYQSAVNPPGGYAGMMQKMKNYILSRGSWMDTNIANDPAIPSKPTVSYTGPTGFPADGLTFHSSNFVGHGGSFAAMQWRIAEITDPNNPVYKPTDPKLYEINADWQSGELTSFNSDVQIPSSAVQLGHTYRVRVRMKDSTGRWSDWSAPVQLVAGTPAVDPAAAVRVTELMYHPADPTPAEQAAGFTNSDDFEFIELTNVASATVDLSGAKLTNAVDYTFPDGTMLAPGARIVVAGNTSAFQTRYGLSIPVVGQYSGKFNNAGEEVTIVGAAGQPILDFTYDDAWYPATDGQGPSLVAVDPAGPTAALSTAAGWRASAVIGGTPDTVDLVEQPAVTSVQVNDGSAQRSMVTGLTVTFDRPVLLGPGAFSLVGRNGAGAGTVLAWSAQNADDQGRASVWTLTFSGTPILGGSLADGIYDLTIAASQVRAGFAAGPLMAADYDYAFHRLYSDVNGDGVSDNADLFQMRSTYLKPSADPAYKWYFDYNADGVVDNADVFQVRSRRSLVFQGY